VALRLAALLHFRVGINALKGDIKTAKAAAQVERKQSECRK